MQEFRHANDFAGRIAARHVKITLWQPARSRSLGIPL